MTKTTDRIVISRETGTKYRIIREYRNCFMVTRADHKRTMPFSLPKTAFISPGCGGGRMCQYPGSFETV